jgi:site-specific recombinase XerD
MPAWAKAAVDAWALAEAKANGYLDPTNTGYVFKPMNKGDNVTGNQINPQAIWRVVETCADALGLTIAPYDLRRSFAKLAHKSGAALDQIQLSLGHASIKTTEKYLGVEQSLTDAPCDYLGLKIRKR